jgi:hypothetical protein
MIVTARTSSGRVGFNPTAVCTADPGGISISERPAGAATLRPWEQGAPRLHRWRRRPLADASHRLHGAAVFANFLFCSGGTGSGAFGE